MFPGPLRLTYAQRPWYSHKEDPGEHITVPARQWKSEVLSWAFSCVTFAYVCLTELCLELDRMILEVAESKAAALNLWVVTS